MRSGGDLLKQKKLNVMEYLSKEYWLHWRINQRFFMKTAYDHPQIGQIVNNALFKRKDETYKLEWRKCWFQEIQS